MRLRCSTFARTAELDPIGTAGSYAGYLLVEQSLPWPKRIDEWEAMAASAAEAAAHGWRLQAVARSGGADGGTVTRYHRRPGPFTRYLSDGSDDRDVLICTHGKRDACCGSLGYALWRSFPPLEGVRVWRTSHTGGHRFAPTAVVLPEGTLWAYLDPDLLCGIVERAVSIEDVLPHYRGCAGLDGPEVQAVERNALAEHGWNWFDLPRHGEVVSRTRDRVLVRLVGGGHTYEAQVEEARQVPVPNCGRSVLEASKTQPELRVVRFERVG